MESDRLGRRLLRNSDAEPDGDGFANGHRATDAFADGDSDRFADRHSHTERVTDVRPELVVRS
jgi:hypothetical protein